MKETSLLNKLLVISLFLFTIAPCYAKRLHPEAEYQKAWCDKRGGLMEYKLSDKTRVDCLLPNMAVEFDFANKWAECIGQAIYYGRQTNRQAACVLIMENGEKDLKYLYRLRRAAYKKGVNLRTFTMKPEHLCIPVNNKTK
jgi:hypothetical protein|nr:MAG TPA: hypothetical protein [Caudoviricetes sp.]